MLERVDLGRDAAAGREGERRGSDERGRFGLRDEVGDDLEELVALLDDGDAVEVEERLDGEEGFIARDRSREREGIDAGGKGLWAEDRLTRPALHQVEDLGDGLIAQDDRADLVRAAETREGHGGGDAGDRCGGWRGGRRRSGLRKAQGRRHGGGDKHDEKGQRGPRFTLGRIGADHGNKGYDLDNTKPEE